MAQTANYPIEIEFENDYNLYPGMVVNIEILINSYENVIYTGKDNIITNYDDNYVFVIEGKKAKKIDIKIEKKINTQYIISGLNEEQKLVVQGVDNLEDNKMVEVRNQNK